MSAVTSKKRKRRFAVRRKRTLDQDIVIDYKLPDTLKRFITDRGKIIPRRISGATQEQQRKITVAVKRARYLGLIPFSVAHETERGFAGEMQAVAQAFATARPRMGSRPPMGGRGAAEGSAEQGANAPEQGGAHDE